MLSGTMDFWLCMADPASVYLHWILVLASGQSQQ
jgi:hypothetical protein